MLKHLKIEIMAEGPHTTVSPY